MASKAEKLLESLASLAPEPEHAGRRAALHLFGEFERVRAERDSATTRLNRFAETIHLLLATLPEHERRDLERQFETIRSGNQHRGGEVFGNVIALFKRDHRAAWTVREILDALKTRGAEPDPKALSNALIYLAKSGRLRRIARGQYVVTDIGVGIEMEGFEQGLSHVTEHDF